VQLTAARRRKAARLARLAALLLAGGGGCAAAAVAGCAPLADRGPYWSCVHLTGPRSLPVCSRVGGGAPAGPRQGGEGG
jgi:hypothetical protein